MNKNKYLKKLLLVSVTMMSAIAVVSCANSSNVSSATFSSSSSDKIVASIQVSKNPNKIEYYVGETFSAEGGEITVTYFDKTTEIKQMTDPDVSISEVNIAINDSKNDSETKTVTVRYEKKSATFKITVSYQLFTVTFDMGYDGAINPTQRVRKNDSVERPSDPIRDNFIFDNWFSDEALTDLYDFSTKIIADCTIYAKWLENVTYYNFVFDLNYKDAKTLTPQKVKEGTPATKPTTDPTRYGYHFDGWYSSASGSTAFNFQTLIFSNVTVYAKWTRTLEIGNHVFTFEAEDSNLDGKTGPGLSGTAGGPGMIQTSTELDASNDRFVGYQYENGCSLEFQFNSDVAVNSAKIIVRLSAELRDFDLNPSNYMIALNNTPISYNTISFTNVPKGDLSDLTTIYALKFKDFAILDQASLNEGMNVISLTTMNNDAMAGTTMTAKAPLIDCVKVESTSVLNWTDRLNLPKKNY